MLEIKLVHFDVRSLGEPARLILKYVNIPFIDERINLRDWPEFKKKTKTGKLPYLEFDGHLIVESYAIYRFLARKYELDGKDEFEAALVDSIADIQKDFNNAILPWLRVLRGYTDGNAAELRKEHFEEPCKNFFPFFTNFLKESQSGFMAPSGLTWVDFVITEFLTTLIQFVPATLENFPELKEYLKRVHEIPKLKDYYSQRPDVY